MYPWTSMSPVLGPGIEKTRNIRIRIPEHKVKRMSEHIHTTSLNITVFPYPLQCAQHVYKLTECYHLWVIAHRLVCGQVSKGKAATVRVSMERILDQESGSLGFCPSPAIAQLCDLGSWFLPPWVLIYPSIEWALGASRIFHSDIFFL